MSHGLGSLQRRIFERLPRYNQNGVSTIALARLLGRDRYSIFRSVNRLHKKGLALRAHDVQPPWHSFWRRDWNTSSNEHNRNRKTINRHKALHQIRQATPRPIAEVASGGIGRIRRF